MHRLVDQVSIALSNNFKEFASCPTSTKNFADLKKFLIAKDPGTIEQTIVYFTQKNIAIASSTLAEYLKELLESVPHSLSFIEKILAEVETFHKQMLSAPKSYQHIRTRGAKTHYLHLMIKAYVNTALTYSPQTVIPVSEEKTEAKVPLEEKTIMPLHQLLENLSRKIQENPNIDTIEKKDIHTYLANKNYLNVRLEELIQSNDAKKQEKILIIFQHKPNITPSTWVAVITHNDLFTLKLLKKFGANLLKNSELFYGFLGKASIQMLFILSTLTTAKNSVALFQTHLRDALEQNNHEKLKDILFFAARQTEKAGFSNLLSTIDEQPILHFYTQWCRKPSIDWAIVKILLNPSIVIAEKEKTLFGEEEKKRESYADRLIPANPLAKDKNNSGFLSYVIFRQDLAFIRQAVSHNIGSDEKASPEEYSDIIKEAELLASQYKMLAVVATIEEGKLRHPIHQFLELIEQTGSASRFLEKLKYYNQLLLDDETAKTKGPLVNHLSNALKGEILFKAIQYNRLDIIKLLLSMGMPDSELTKLPRINSTLIHPDIRHSALSAAIKWERGEIFQAILTHINIVRSPIKGNTRDLELRQKTLNHALIVAQRYHQTAFEEILIHEGATVTSATPVSMLSLTLVPATSSTPSLSSSRTPTPNTQMTIIITPPS